MKILFLVNSMQGGGAERVAALLCNHWAAQGHRVSLMPTFSGRGECLYPLDERVRLDYLADRVGTTRKSVSSLVRRFLTLRRVIREEGPDVVVSFLTNVNVAALLASAGVSVRVVVSERIYPPLVPLAQHWQWLRRLTYPWAHCVVMQTEQGREWLRDCCPRATASVIPNPVVYPLPASEPRVLPERWLEGNRQRVLAVGRLHSQKGFDDLIRAFARLANGFSEWDLAIVGEGSERERLETIVAEKGLEGRVHLPGRVGNVADWYECANLYVMSSHFEGFPNTLVEAMAHGLPTVSVDCPTGPRDIIRDGVDGLLVPPAEGEEGLARAMARLMADEPSRERMTKQAVTARERFAMARIGALWEEVLEPGGPADA